MSEFKVGDRVEIVGYGDRYPSESEWNGSAVVRKVYDDGVTVDMIGKGPRYEGRFFAFDFVRPVLTKPQFVNVVTSRSIWVTLPGDNESHKLTEDEAKALFRQLEEVV